MNVALFPKTLSTPARHDGHEDYLTYKLDTNTFITTLLSDIESKCQPTHDFVENNVVSIVSMCEHLDYECLVLTLMIYEPKVIFLSDSVDDIFIKMFMDMSKRVSDVAEKEKDLRALCSHLEHLSLLGESVPLSDPRMNMIS